MLQRVPEGADVQTCHTAASVRPSRNASLVLALALDTLLHGGLLPVGTMAMEVSSTAIIGLGALRGQHTELVGGDNQRQTAKTWELALETKTKRPGYAFPLPPPRTNSARSLS